MTGKPLDHFKLCILKKLLQVEKLSNSDIAFVLECDERTIRRRRTEFATTGDLAKKRDVGKNAEKFKREHVEILIEWLKTHDDALLEDCQRFLKEKTGLETSTSTISRHLKRTTGVSRPSGRWRQKAKVGAEDTDPESTAALYDNTQPPGEPGAV